MGVLGCHGGSGSLAAATAVTGPQGLGMSGTGDLGTQWDTPVPQG